MPGNIIMARRKEAIKGFGGEPLFKDRYHNMKLSQPLGRSFSLTFLYAIICKKIKIFLISQMSEMR